LKENPGISSAVHEETVFFPSSEKIPIQLEGRLFQPQSPPTIKAVICHPHPQFGGNLENKVVEFAVRAVAGKKGTTLRFNFRGVGRSEGVYGQGVDEVHDLRGAVAFLTAQSPSAPLLLVGYSFGTAVVSGYLTSGGKTDGVVLIAPPLEMYDLPSLAPPARWGICAMVGDQDFFCTKDRFLSYIEAMGPGAQSHILSGADHFFSGYLTDIANIIQEVIGKK